MPRVSGKNKDRSAPSKHRTANMTLGNQVL